MPGASPRPPRWSLGASQRRDGWFVGAAVLGWAFVRTRSLAVPTLLHAGHNLLFFALVWGLER